jgi:hypothetical protein
VNIFTEHCLFCSLNDENLACGTGFNANESKRKRDSNGGGRLNYVVTRNAKVDMREPMVAVISDSISQSESNPSHPMYSYRDVDETMES